MRQEITNIKFIRKYYEDQNIIKLIRDTHCVWAYDAKGINIGTYSITALDKYMIEYINQEM